MVNPENTGRAGFPLVWDLRDDKRFWSAQTALAGPSMVQETCAIARVEIGNLRVRRARRARD